jgi:predicted small metal-binding protein
MAHVIACGDVISGCAAVFEGADEDDLLAQVGRHAAADHGIVEITPGVLDAVRAAIRVA